MAASIVIYRRQDAKVKRLGKNQLAETVKRVNRKTRVKRDNVVSFFLEGGFNNLPVTPQSVIDSPYRREDEAKGWEIPAEDLGRIGEATPSAAESIRLWVKQNLGDYVNPDAVSVVYIEGEE